VCLNFFFTHANTGGVLGVAQIGGAGFGGGICYKTMSGSSGVYHASNTAFTSSNALGEFFVVAACVLLNVSPSRQVHCRLRA
jgi:hypothetical protein